ncbi:DOPA 4,5-dioxygenase family protein [Bdellovibrio sp. 22V]|uniref:DOPA 4,5-dioxygenase family protein n=1 Tax=Bdellovibrio TaxID=958 RepID=UPI002542B359|nr:DOPA 4,5-dioxygenase family protein [Bdellovibrio sp. 22V]WII73536.1 DOPA 4,5-dioxygenase family protein [Bdellovibrio sp. 22V]
MSKTDRPYKVNSQLLPEGFPREFDAHIYFSPESRDMAEALRSHALKEFAGQKVFTGEMIPEAIGPHPIPMFEINFPKEYFTDVVLWLMKNRGDLSVLVHELTGDDLYDHTQAALWLGTPVSLDYSKFK